MSNSGDCCNKAAGAVACTCIGFICFPASLCVLAWNEHRTVCEGNYITYAHHHARSVGCSAEKVQDEFVHFSCPFVESTLQNFTPCLFNAGMLCEDPISLADVVSFQSVSAEQVVEMVQCLESCNTRTQESRHQSANQCSYRMEWTSQYHDSMFFLDKTAAEAACFGFQRTLGNPVWPANVGVGTTSMVVAGPVRAGEASHPFTIPKALLEELTPDTAVAIPATQVQGKLDPYTQRRPLVVTKENTLVVGNFLQTCSGFSLGCVRIAYRKNGATNPTVIGHVASGGIVEPQDVPATLLCPEEERQWIEERHLPLKAFIRVLEHQNRVFAWTIRLGGIIAAWISVFFIFSPLTTAVDIVGDAVNFVPFLGRFIEDVLEGLATCLVCLLSCGIGCSCALFVIAFVWIGMRPLVGSILLILGCCLFFGGVGLSRFLRGDDANKTQRLDKKERKRLRNDEGPDGSLEMATIYQKQ
eukprot:TRINITY_DN54601_c0_g1_i1.p1 TRINITY_DN54601_c0_g1~~TRINITY_DN54601_c0_g1_i1.p1  ORF type:complete len:471 (+),score=68.25 TRINITY_DN54601_c0_g1_i1:43-1455(+)